MIFGVNQPYFIPYLGYWQLINAVDVFEIGDNYNFIKRGWIPRNRILINGVATFFRVEVEHASLNKKINELFLTDFSAEEKLNTLIRAYKKAPYFNDGMKLMEDILFCKEKNLADFLSNSIYQICDFLGINTKLVTSSSLDRSDELKREYRIYDACERFGADKYYNAIGGTSLYSFQDFKNHGIELGFLKMDDITYKQFSNEFVPNLSIIDVIMFNSKEEIKKMLNQYAILREDGYEKD